MLQPITNCSGFRDTSQFHAMVSHRCASTLLLNTTYPALLDFLNITPTYASGAEEPEGCHGVYGAWVIARRVRTRHFGLELPSVDWSRRSLATSREWAHPRTTERIQFMDGNVELHGSKLEARHAVVYDGNILLASERQEHGFVVQLGEQCLVCCLAFRVVLDSREPADLCLVVDCCNADRCITSWSVHTRNY